jgi:dipeptidyl aminopeptidase/acylaminoacyl peptidase
MPNHFCHQRPDSAAREFRGCSRAVLALVCGSAAAALLLAPTGRAQSRRALSLTDLLTAVRVTEPALSPDGRLVAFVRTTTDVASGKRNADIYVVPSDGSAPPRLLAGGTSMESTPQFLPDGKRVVYISDANKTPQVYIVNLEGGEPKPVTSLKLGVAEPLIPSPDGRFVAFVSDAFRDCPDEVCNARRAEEVERDSVKMRRLTELMFRHWNEWREQKRQHVFVAPIEGGPAKDITPGDYDAPPHNYESGGIAFSPDSRQIAFVSKREGRDVEAWSTNMDIWLTSVSGGEIRKLTQNPAADASPIFTPDGRSVLVRSQRRAGFESDRWYIDVYDLSGGAKRTVFGAPDLSADDVSLSPDGDTVWFTADDQGRVNLFSVPFSGGAPKRVAVGGALGAIDAGRGFAIATKSSLTSPAEIVRVSSDGTATALTRENAGWLRDVSIPEPESHTVRGAGGTTVQYWLFKPTDFDPSRKYPTVFLIHGGPQGAWNDAWSSRWNPALWAAQGWVIAAPNPRGSFGFGQKFVDEISQDWGGKVMTDIDAVVTAVAAMPFVDANRLGIAGASYGGYAVDWIIGHTNRFKAAVSHDGVFNLESMAFATEELWFPEWEFGGPPWSAAARANFAKWSPHLFADRIRTPTLIITNELDFRVPVDQGLQMLTALRRNGVPAEALVFPDEGHWIGKALNSKRWHEAVFAWMRRYL